jgi:hypothetical protein
MIKAGKVVFGLGLAAIVGYVVRTVISAGRPQGSMVFKRSPLGSEVKKPGETAADSAGK